MAEQHSIHIPAHYNIYSGATGRELRVDFSIPSEGVNETTGLLLLVPGFGGNIDSKVYSKMRNVFADQFNLITIQCDYFGSSHMQSTEAIHFSDLTSLEKMLTTEEIQQINSHQSHISDILAKKKWYFACKSKID